MINQLIEQTTREHLHRNIPYRMIKSRWLVGTDDLCTVEIMHSSRVSKFWIFFENLDFLLFK